MTQTAKETRHVVRSVVTLPLTGVGDVLLDKGEVQPATNAAPTTAKARNIAQYDLFI
ncbi:MAG: hypothetical protein ACXVH4_04890 [Halobacteriota archaeon]